MKDEPQAEYETTLRDMYELGKQHGYELAQKEAELAQLEKELEELK